VIKMKSKSLADKLQDNNYLDSLSGRRLREILFCEKMLNEEELEQESSIQVGYKKAREKFIATYLEQLNPELAEQARERKTPIFNMLETLQECQSQ